MTTRLAFGVEPSNRRYHLRLARYQGVVDAVRTFRQETRGQALSLLDVGAGQGRTLRYLKAAGLDRDIAFHGIDNAPKRQQKLFEPERWDYRLADVEHGLPYADASFDIVICEQVLEHLDKPQLVLEQIARVLRPGGMAILGVPSFPPGVASVREHIVPRVDRLTGHRRDHAQVFTRRSFAEMVHQTRELAIQDVRAFRCMSGGLLAPLENFHWWYRFNRHAATRLASFATEIQVVARRAPGGSVAPQDRRRQGERLEDAAGAEPANVGRQPRARISLNFSRGRTDGGALSAPARRVLLSLPAVVVLMVLLASALGARGPSWYADESGLLEQASVWLWLGLGGALLALLRPVTWGVAAMAGTCLVAAAVEGDWHESLTGYSLWGVGAYLANADYPIAERLVAGGVTKLSLLCAVITGWTIYGHLRERGGWRAGWTQLLLIFLGVGVVTELLDQSAVILDRSFGVGLQVTARDLVQACEEGLELLLPLLLLGSAILFARIRKDPAPRDPEQAAARP
ncbi:MAG: methyltransferase domain-containing protein [Phycisphaeraceae bacterium]